MVYNMRMPAKAPGVQLRDLADLLGSQRQVGKLLGVSHSQVARWIKGGPARSPSIRRIADAFSVVDALRRREGGDASAAVVALMSPWQELDYRRPADLIAADRAGDVLRLLRAQTLEWTADNASSVAWNADLVSALNALAAAASATADALRQA